VACAARPIVVCFASAALLAAGAGTAVAQGRLEARYDATLAGLKLGQGTWIVETADGQFTAIASGVTSGLARVFGKGEGTSVARGAIKGNEFQPASYVSTVTTGRKTEDIRMTLNGGAVKEVAVTPPLPHSDTRVPVTEAHKRNVFDPMTAALLRIPGNGDLLAQENCQRHAAIFDGRMRYDLNLAFKRHESVKVKGYEGQALVCSVLFAPLAGHVPGRMAIKYLVAQRDMEVWLAPIAGTRMLAPIRMRVPTPLGMGELEATQFVSTPLPGRAAEAPRGTGLSTGGPSESR
jgi:hypothetical protein